MRCDDIGCLERFIKDKLGRFANQASRNFQSRLFAKGQTSDQFVALRIQAELNEQFIELRTSSLRVHFKRLRCRQ